MLIPCRNHNDCSKWITFLCVGCFLMNDFLPRYWLHQVCCHEYLLSWIHKSNFDWLYRFCLLSLTRNICLIVIVAVATKLGFHSCQKMTTGEILWQKNLQRFPKIFLGWWWWVLSFGGWWEGGLVPGKSQRRPLCLLERRPGMLSGLVWQQRLELTAKQLIEIWNFHQTE